MSRHRFARRTAALFVLPLVATRFTVGAASADSPDLRVADAQPVLTDKLSLDKAPTSRLAETDRKLAARTDDAPVQVMIKLDHDSLATYAGGVSGLEATSPSVTGKSLSKRVPQAEVGQSFRVVYGGVSAVVPANTVDDIAAMPGVVAVQADKMHKLLTDSSPAFLGAPSAYAPLMPGKITTVRTAKNVSGLKVKWVAETTAPTGSTITVSSKQFTLDPGQSVDLTITIASTKPPAQYFGEVRLLPKTAGLPSLHLPVAFRTGQSAVTLASSCTPTQIAVNATSSCDITATDTGFADTEVDLKTTLNQYLKVDSVTGATKVDNRTVVKSDVPLAGKNPGVPSVDAGSLFGYIPLSAFGIAPTPIGDEQIINLDVPNYVYNGATYSRIGIDSNGYLIAGGGSSQDNNCCNLPGGPDPARPNNILAPFWTDLDGAGAEGIYASVLTDGVGSWLVIEYRVNVFGTADKRTFQVWIGINGTQDITYAAPQGNPAGQPFLVGAENELGEGDMTAVLPTTDQRVTSTAPTPGGSVSYNVGVKGVMNGPGTVTTDMTGTGVPGTTTVVSEAVVGP